MGFGNQTQAPATGGFGQTATIGGFGQKPAGGGFGAQTQAPATGGFGAGLKFGAQGQAPATGAGFGATSTVGGFGQKPAIGGFGSPSQTATGGGFGQKTAAVGFGQKPATGGFGAQTQAPTTGGFGATGAGFGANKSAGFGAQTSPAKAGFGASTGGAGFGAGQAKVGFGGTTGGFGANKSPGAGAATSTGLPSFGQLGAAGATTAGGFGTAKSGFGATAGAGFGAATSGGFGSKPGGFGSPGATAGAGGFGGGFGGGAGVGAAGGSGFGMSSGGFGAAGGQPLVAVTEPPPESLEFDLSGLERPESSGGKSTEGSVPVYSKTQTSYRYIPRSAARIQPRGMHTESTKSDSNSTSKSFTTILDPSSLQGERRDQLMIGYQVKSAEDTTNDNDDGEESTSYLNSSSASHEKSSDKVETPQSKGGYAGGDATGLTPSAEIVSPYVDLNESSTDRNKLSLNMESTSSGSPPPSSSKSTLLVAPKPINFPIKPESPPNSKSLKPILNENAPVLTKTGYDCHPNLRELQRMSDDELSEVKNFVVFRPGVGQIKWEGDTDLRNLNLDDVVVIENRMISVYDDLEETEKPPRGTALNKSAVVTLYQISPKNITAESIEKFEKKLQKNCSKNGSEFLHYDVDLEEWMFRVTHF